MGEDKSLCPLCQETNACGIMKGEENCWCFSFPAKLPLNDPLTSCYCAACLAKIQKRKDWVE